MNPTGTEARVCADIAARQAKGTAKYGTTVQDNPLGLTQWLQHAYEECLDQAVYLKRAIELLQGVQDDTARTVYGATTDQDLFGFDWPSKTLWKSLHEAPAKEDKPTPLDDPHAELLKKFDTKEGDDHIRQVKAESNTEDPHAELRKTWREGQLWQYRNRGMPWHDFVDMSTGRAMQPAWMRDVEYRRHPEDKDPEPAPPADPHAALKAIYRPGMRWRSELVNGSLSEWRTRLPQWDEELRYEIHPEDLPKSPDTDGWITVPDDLMEMPEGLGNMHRIDVRFRNGAICEDLPAGAFAWIAVPVNDPARVVAYRLIKPAE